MNEVSKRMQTNKEDVSRRRILKILSGAALGVVMPWGAVKAVEGLKGRITQSVCLWCYDNYLKRTNTNLDSFAASCAKIGLRSIEITRPELWPTLKKQGLICAMTPSHGITKGLNRIENHDECLEKIRRAIDDSSAAGFPNVITFSGNRAGMDDDEGLENCVIGLKKIAGYAEREKVTICLELLNSIDHKDYMADSTQWCVKLVKQVGSPRVKILYDIYHAAMMKEDVLADIQNYSEYWGHYHTGGYPGRNEIDDTQTLDYAKIMRAIIDTGYSGWVAQEFVPKREDALGSLQQAVAICDV
jgi:hydroxypyruvate isomerase